MKRDDVLKFFAEHRTDMESFGVKSLAIFGSVARDEARGDSDLDLLVEFEGSPTYARYCDVKFFVEDALGCKVDLVTRGGLKARVLPYVEKDLIRVA